MKKKDRLVAAAAVLLALVMIVGISALAANYGTAEDPLVTLSYIRDVLTPDFKTKSDAAIDEAKSGLEASFNEKIDSISKQLEGSGNAMPEAYTYSVVTLQSGQRLIGSVGTELMLRVGSASCYASGSTGIIDTTTAATLENGNAMQENHLYMVTIDGRGMTASSYVMVLVRGAYKVQ